MSACCLQCPDVALFLRRAKLDGFLAGMPLEITNNIRVSSRACFPAARSITKSQRCQGLNIKAFSLRDSPPAIPWHRRLSSTAIRAGGPLPGARPCPPIGRLSSIAVIPAGRTSRTRTGQISPSSAPFSPSSLLLPLARERCSARRSKKRTGRSERKFLGGSGIEERLDGWQMCRSSARSSTVKRGMRSGKRETERAR